MIVLHLLALSPNGTHIVMSMRGPHPRRISAPGHAGVGISNVTKRGREGTFEWMAAVSSVIDAIRKRAEVQGLTIRIARWRGRDRCG